MSNNVYMIKQTNVTVVSRPPYQPQLLQGPLPVREITEMAHTVNHTVKQIQSVLPVLAQLSRWYR